jgi:hypothetical protein
MTILALVRAGSVNFPLFLHVAGAMVLVGGLVAGASSLAFAGGNVRFLRLGYWSLLALALPGWVLMRVGAEWVFREESYDKLPDDALPDWLTTGAFIGDIGGAVLLVSLILGGIGVYRLRGGGGARLLKATLALSVLLVAAYLVAVWSMTGKPEY